MKKFFLLLFTGFLSVSLIPSQTLRNADAAKVVSGSDLVTLDDSTKSIKHFRFLRGQKLVTAENKYLKGIFKLPKEYDLKELNTTSDKFGSITKNQFTFKGIPVEDFIYTVQKEGSSIKAGNGYYKNLKERQFARGILRAEEEALKKALSYINAKKYIWEVDQNFTRPKPQLYYIEKNNELVLVYKIDIYSIEPLSRNFIYVNAENGEIERISDRIQIYTNSNGTAYTKYQGVKTIKTDLYSGSYRLRENSRGTGIETYDLNNGTSYSSAVDFIDTDNTWNTTTNQDDAALDAHYGAEATYDYYYTKFGRNSIDGAGFLLKSYVHYSSGYVNAFWNGTCMTYGDGDGSSYTALTSIDVVAHEISHGLTSYTANLNYSYESGALNESFSDIFGTAVDFYANPTTANYLMGDQISTSGTPFRSMINPNLYDQPDTYHGYLWYTGAGDNGGVHYNSGVQNFWFYLLCVGGSGTNDNGDAYSVNSIGMDKAAAIAYRTLTVYLTPTSQYSDARYYSIQAAIDLYGDCSNEVINVTNAWHAVGVGSTYSNAVVSDFVPSMNYFCSTPALVNFTNKCTNASTYAWNFGDGATSTVANPSHTYSSVGNYTVTLIATGTSICNSSDTFVSPNAIVVTNTGGPISATCTPLTLSSTGAYGITNFTFNGIVNNSAGASDGYKDYTCNYASTVTEGVFYNYSVTIATSSASKFKIWLDLNNDGSFNNTDELLADASNVLTTKNGSILIPHPIIYNTPLRLRIASDANSTSNLTTACSNSNYGQYEDYTVIIHQNTLPPDAEFTANNTTILTGASVNFTDLSLNIPTSYSWTFEGGTPGTSTLKNPVITYNTLGSFKVKLVTSNSYGIDSVIKTAYINVVNAVNMCSATSTTSSNGTLYDSGGPTGSYQNGENCSFLINPTCATSVTLSFNSFYTESGYDYFKVYDGTSSSGTLLLSTSGSSLPSPVTANSGKMYITFTTDGSVTYSGFEALWSTTLISGTPVSDFSISNNNPAMGAEVQFSDLSTKMPTSWQWSFGDGTTSTVQNPKHIYSSSGTYNVSLIASNCNGTGTTTVKTVTVQGPAIINISPSSITDVINSCADTIYKTLTIQNTGTGSLIWNSQDIPNSISDDFDPAVDATVWYAITGGVAANTCGFHSAPNSLYFNATVTRSAITNSINTTGGGKINFYLEISSGSAPCETADPGEGITLSYSTNSGATWTVIRTYNPGSYNSFTSISENIPAGAISSSTMFKWEQPSHSGQGFDNWSIDDISIERASQKIYTLNPTSGVCAPGSSVNVSVRFVSTGFSSGILKDTIRISCNDTAHRQNIVPCEITINGAPEISLSKGSLNFGTIYNNYTKPDTLIIFNNGCANLNITNITTSLTEYSVNKTSFIIQPGKKDTVKITFAPLSTGTYNGTITIFNNDVNQTLNMFGSSLSAPSISFSPTSFSPSITCNDSITLPLTITNSGGSSLSWSSKINSVNISDDFDPGIDNTVWQSITGGIASASCDFYSAPNALYFDGSTRTAITKSINTSNLDSIKFYLKIGSGSSPCEMADAGEDIILSYSVNGGSTWTTINTYYTGNYSIFTPIRIAIPASAKTIATQFRWSQPVNSGSGCDNWSIDNVVISGNQNNLYTLSSYSGVINGGSSATINVKFKSGVNTGILRDTIKIEANDPLHLKNNIPCQITVSGSPHILLSASNLNFGTVFNGYSRKDTLVIKNTGCTNLNITNITSSLSEFTINKTSTVITPSGRDTIFVTFTPSVIGTYNGTLTIFNSDADKTVNLSGTCALPPIINLSVDSFYVPLANCNDSIEVPLLVSNTGTSDLIYNIKSNSTKPVELLALTYGVDYDEEYAHTITAINQYFTNYNLTEVNTTSASTLQAQLAGKDALLIPEQEVGTSSVFTGFATVLQSFVNNGGTVIFCGTDNSSCIFNTGLFTGTLNNITSSGTMNVVNSNHPITDQVPSSINANNATFMYTFTNTDTTRLVRYGTYDIVTCRTMGKGKVAYVGFDYYAYDNNAARLIANAVKWSANLGLPKWLVLSKTADTIVGGGSKTLKLKFKSGTLQTGVYNTNLYLRSNDPINSNIRIPAYLDVTSTPLIPSTISGLTSVCLGSTSSYSITNVPGTTYTWTVTGGTISGSGSSINVSWYSTGSQTLTVTPSNLCGNGPGRSLTVVVNSTPSLPSFISGNTNPCLGTDYSYSVSSVAGITYTWTATNGTITGSGNSVNIMWNASGNQTLTVTPSNNCGSGSSRTLTVLVNKVPDQPSVISGSTNACVGSTINYSVTTVSGVTYSWYVSGGSYTGSGNSINVTWLTAGSNTITVVPSNGCGNGTNRILNVNVVTVPSQPSAISGNTTICSGVSETFSVTKVNNVDYTWTSTGADITQYDNSVDVIWNSSGTKTLTVTPSNACGSGSSQTLNVAVGKIPAQPSIIAGNSSVCLGSSESYSVTNVSGVSYTWVVSGGTSVVNGNSASVQWNSSGNQLIIVTPSNYCGDGISRMTTATVNEVPQLFNVTGGGDFCTDEVGAKVGLTNSQTNINYQLLLDGINTGSPVAGTGNPIDFGNKTAAGVYTVQGINPLTSCTSNMNGNAVVNEKLLPASAGAIIGTATVCQGQNQVSYSVPAINNADSYEWILPSGASIISGNNTSSIVIDFSSSALSGNITVKGVNACGKGTESSFFIAVNKAYYITRNISICEGENYNGITVSTNYVDNFTTTLGCDSIITTNIIVTPIYHISESITICQGESYRGHTEKGTYTDTLSSASGCDSIVTTNLSVNPSYNLTVNISICDGENYKGHTSSGTYIENLTTILGCDSIVTTNLTVNPTYHKTESITICQGESYRGHISKGTYIDTLNSISGCDSIVTTTLNVNPSYKLTNKVSICQGESYNGHYTSGNYVDNLKTIKGCDSIVTTALTVNPVYYKLEKIIICQGESYRSHTETGIYIDTLQSKTGCDSIVITNLKVNKAYMLNQSISICKGETYKGHSTSGSFTEKLKTSSGCDSIIITNLTVNDVPATPTITYNEDDKVLNSSSLSGNQWYRDNTLINGAVDNIYKNPSKGDYYVIVTENSCSSTASKTIFVDSYNSVYENKIADFKLHPNPTMGLVEISSEDVAIKQYKLVVYNSLGASIYVNVKNMDEHTLQIDLTNYPSGIYMVKVYNKNSEKIFRVIRK